MSMKFLKSAASYWKKVSGNVVLKDSSAKVGIGVAPTFNLELAGQARFTNDSSGTAVTGPTMILANNNATDNNYAGIDFRTQDDGGGTEFPASIYSVNTHAASTATGNLVFYTNPGSVSASAPTERMRINEDGAITAPSQPAFLAKPVLDQSDIAAGGVDIAFATEVFDQGGDFATPSFTAPVDGLYQFNAAIRLNSVDAGATYYQLQLVTTASGGIYYGEIFSPDVLASDPGYWHVGFSILAQLDANDTAKLVLNQSGGSAQTDISTQSYFSGFLAC